jgi:hypothetical protein
MILLKTTSVALLGVQMIAGSGQVLQTFKSDLNSDLIPKALTTTMIQAKVNCSDRTESPPSGCPRRDTVKAYRDSSGTMMVVLYQKTQDVA